VLTAAVRGELDRAVRRVNATLGLAGGHLCQVTRRARLSYRRAAESFERATRPLANPGARHEELEEVHGWTLHQLRHSRDRSPEMTGQQSLSC